MAKKMKGGIHAPGAIESAVKTVHKHYTPPNPNLKGKVKLP